MNPVYIIIGALIGGVLGKWVGVVGGALIGYLLGEMVRVGERLAELEKDVVRLRKLVKPGTVESPTAASPQTAEQALSSPDPSASMSDTGQTAPVRPQRHSFQETISLKGPAESQQDVSHADFIFRRVEEPSSPREEGRSAPSAPAGDFLGRFFGENLLVKIGVVILFFGVSFLVKYAAQHGMFPLELRLATAALGGCGLIGTGWRLRDRRAVYAQVIQGGGIGILYLTTFAAMRLYHLIPTMAGFAFLVTVCALAALLAVLQDSRSLAVLGTTGGFLAPELASIGSGSPAVLFSYYLVLNAGIIGIARYRAWRSLNLLGFVFTFIVSAAWGGRFYRPEHFATVEPFLILFFLIYTGVAILFARHQQPEFKGYLDGTLVFGTPIVAFALQAGLVHNHEFGLAWSAFALGFFYLGLAVVLFRLDPDTMRPFSDAFLAFGIVFATLAIPLAFDGRWTTAAWGMEGAALVWAGLRQDRQLARGFGYLLLIGSGVTFMAAAGNPTGGWPVLNGFYVGCLMVSGASLFSAYLLYRQSYRLEPWETGIVTLLFGWGMVWWFGSGLHEIDRYLLADIRFGCFLAFVAISCGVCQLFRPRLAWQLLDIPSLGLLPAMVIFAAVQLLTGMGHPAGEGGYYAWPFAFVVLYSILWNHEERYSLLGSFHAAALWLLAALGAWELHWQIDSRLPGMTTWALIVWGVIPSLLAHTVVRRGEAIAWPVARHYGAYFGLGSGPLVLFAWLWCVGANLTNPGNPWPLPYLPLLNPLDCATALVLITLAAWYRKAGNIYAAELPHGPLRIAFAATGFIWLNAILLRTIHHWGGVPFSSHVLFHSMLVQAALSIFWSLLALVVMTMATRRTLRGLWLTGAGLLAVVVGKLFLVDLANSGTVERIVSFVVVGILLLVIGWFTPVPPRTGEGGAA